MIIQKTLKKIFSDFFEINAISQIKNLNIIILENKNLDENIYYHKLAQFEHSENNIYDLYDIVFINFINDNHYQLLKPKKDFILSRINNMSNLIYNYVIYDRKNKKIIDVRNENKSIRDDEVKINKKNTEKRIKIKNENKDIIQIKKSNNNNIENKIIISNNINDNDYQNNILDAPFDITNYKYLLSNFKEKEIEIENNKKIIIPKYPILIGNKINIDYYSDIYRYLYIEKYNLNLPRYPNWVSQIKAINKKDNKKKELRERYKKYYLDENNNLFKKKKLKKNLKIQI